MKDVENLHPILHLNSPNQTGIARLPKVASVENRVAPCPTKIAGPSVARRKIASTSYGTNTQEGDESGAATVTPTAAVGSLPLMLVPSLLQKVV